MNPTTPRRTPGAATSLLGAILVAAACSHPEAPLGARPTAARATAAPPAVPVKFADGIISDAREQWRITFTPDGRTAYFASSADFFPFTRQATIYVSRLGHEGWTAPEIAPFSGQYSDIDPFLAPNGERLYFSSIRPIDGVMPKDIDLWYVERTADGWGEPIHLGPEVNSSLDELYPSADADGTLYFASGPFAPHAELHWDIFRADRRGEGFAPREGLAAINTTPVPGGGLQDAWEFNPEISVDGKTLVFTSLRPGGHGLGDLYASRLEGGEWSAPRNLGPLVNTASDEYHPTLSRNGSELYFVRRIPYRGDFYRIGTKALGLK